MERHAAVIRLLDRHEVTDVSVVGAHRLEWHEGGTRFSAASPFENEAQAHSFAVEILSSRGRSWDAREPYFDIQWGQPPTHRVHGVLPPIAPRTSPVP